ncbi:DUF4194 domain-containing protein [Mycobacterium sp. NPDC003449]
MTLSDFNFDKLPEVQQSAAATGASRLPRFEGDSGELPSQACWALQNLLTRRYISKDAHPDLWGWVIDHRRVLASRLCELDLKLRIHEDLEVTYAEQAQPDTQYPRARKLLRREPMGTYASILALQLARIARTSRADQLIGRDDIHELFIGIRHKKDRDEAMLRGRVEDAIAKMVKVKVLLPSGDDPDSFSISPAILAVMSGQMVDELDREFERLRRESDGGPVHGSGQVDLNTDDVDAEGWAATENGTSDDD